MDREIKVVGLTGGIGTGKSTAAAYLKGKGFFHIDADEIGRQITMDGSPMLALLNDSFGPSGPYGQPGVEIIDDNGSLDRRALASIVFTDQEKKKKLDQLMFKEIIRRIDGMISRIKAGGLFSDDMSNEPCGEKQPVGILLDAPLLFEAGLETRCDMVLLMVADEAVRIRRVCERDGVTAREVRNRINSQMSDEEKRGKSHVIIDNSTTKEHMEKQLEDFLRTFLRNFQKILANTLA